MGGEFAALSNAMRDGYDANIMEINPEPGPEQKDD